MASPAAWLAASWAHNPSGALVALAWAGLVVASVASGPARGDHAGAAAALALGIGIRIVARWAQIDSLGALVLVLDAYAVARMLGLGRRPLAVHPGWLAALFAASLPVEAIASRVIGWPLRLSAAEVTAVLVGAARQGTRIIGEAAQLDVDLPCSGIQGLSLLTVLALVLLAARRGSPAALLLAVAGAFGANVLRLLALYGGLAAGWPVMDEPMHSAIGVVALMAGALPLLLLARRWPARSPAPVRTRKPLPVWAAGGLSALAVVAALAPLPTMEAAAPPAVALPASMGRWIGEPLPLLDGEAAFFEKAGGSIEKRRYDAPGESQRTVMLIRTANPLRLHDPTLCLSAEGWAVERIGLREQTALWRATSPQGQPFLVTVDFQSTRGEAASSVSEMIWRWSRRPDAGWIVIEQITPWSACQAGDCETFDAHLRSALEV